VRIAVLSPFSSFSDSYSLAHASSQQVAALLRRGHEVELWTLANLKVESEPMLAGFVGRVKPCIGVTKWEQDKTTAESADSIAADLSESIQRYRPEVIITHDALFQSWYVDTARAIHSLASTPIGRSARWFHVAHSVISPSFAPPAGDQVYRRTMPEGHTLLCLQPGQEDLAARYYSMPVERVKWCPNVHDPRAMWPVHPLAERIIGEADLFSREIVQIYPFCATRTVSKGVPALLRIFRAIQRRGTDAALVLVDANACDSKSNGLVEKAIADAEGVEVFRSSRMHGTAGCKKVVPHRAVMDLMRAANLFVFPTVGEACPLILIEAMAAGCVPVVNEQASAVVSYAPENAVRFRLPGPGATTRMRVEEADGTVREDVLTGEDAYEAAVDRVAERCIEAVRQCPAAQAKVRAQRLFSYEAVGQRLTEIIRG